MNQVNHTPGPWEMAEATSTIPIRGNGKTVASVRYGPTDLDDARLIAAAPDMLEAAKAVLFYLDSLPRVDQYAVAMALRAAIHKAEGRA